MARNRGAASDEPHGVEAEQRRASEGDGSSGAAGRGAKLGKAALVLGLLVLVSPAVSFLLPGGTYVIASGSMEPSIPKGAIVVATPEDPQVGDVVVYEAATGTYQVHRVIEVDRSEDGTSYTTKGDNNDGRDSFVVEADQIQGVVSVSLPFVGSFWLLPFALRYVLLAVPAGVYVVLSRHRVPDGQPEEGAEDEHLDDATGARASGPGGGRARPE